MCLFIGFDLLNDKKDRFFCYQQLRIRRAIFSVGLLITISVLILPLTHLFCMGLNIHIVYVNIRGLDDKNYG